MQLQECKARGDHYKIPAVFCLSTNCPKPSHHHTTTSRHQMCSFIQKQCLQFTVLSLQNRAVCQTSKGMSICLASACARHGRTPANAVTKESKLAALQRVHQRLPSIHSIGISVGSMSADGMAALGHCSLPSTSSTHALCNIVTQHQCQAV